jgi:hypothetical protein
MPTGLVNGYDTFPGKLWTTLPTVPNSLFVISICLDPLSMWLTIDFSSHRCEASCHLPAAHTWHRFCQHRIAWLGTPLGQLLQYQRSVTLFLTHSWNVPRLSHLLWLDFVMLMIFSTNYGSWNSRLNNLQHSSVVSLLLVWDSFLNGDMTSYSFRVLHFQSSLDVI